MPLIRLVNKNTIINRDNIFDVKCDVSIWLDIFPLDGAPENYSTFKRQIFLRNVYIY